MGYGRKLSQTGLAMAPEEGVTEGGDESSYRYFHVSYRGHTVFHCIKPAQFAQIAQSISPVSCPLCTHLPKTEVQSPAQDLPKLPKANVQSPAQCAQPAQGRSPVTCMTNSNQLNSGSRAHALSISQLGLSLFCAFTIDHHVRCLCTSFHFPES